MQLRWPRSGLYAARSFHASSRIGMTKTMRRTTRNLNWTLRLCNGDDQRKEYENQAVGLKHV